MSRLHHNSGSDEQKKYAVRQALGTEQGAHIYYLSNMSVPLFLIDGMHCSCGRIAQRPRGRAGAEG